MLVKNQMTSNPITVRIDTPISRGQEIMAQHNIRHIPVVDEAGKLVGLLTRETILKAIPWTGSTLSTLETQYILSKITAQKAMIPHPLTITENIAVEEAARIMVDHKISCLPVLKAGELVGIITDIDLLSTTMEMLGARRSGLRLSVFVPNKVGEMVRLASAIAKIGGNLIAFGTWEGDVDFATGKPSQIGVVLKVEDISQSKLETALTQLDKIEILDIRQV